MGITHASARFVAQVPALDRIAAEITRRIGLEVLVRESGADVRSTMFAMHGEIAFACLLRERVKVYAYQPWIPQEPSGETLAALAAMDPAAAARARHLLNGGRSAGDHQTVHVQGYVSEEGTLFDVTTLTLESLGGALSIPMTDVRRREASSPLTPATLRARHRAHGRAWLLGAVKALGSLPMIFARRLVRRHTRGGGADDVE